eukprot:CAMPEP_0180651520 /NCGR_PEP_ID=MMETSP1037_2-20121125/52934_1 /TAXON_ID=632150 /ORGANISM="Azadinium spinosum, Strain 3D9" /LENGTH=185 /DNA_ID=CAMNT_0022677185 /DNA_START=145 /DNA_END=699 /DNA_ORIENTATION=+
MTIRRSSVSAMTDMHTRKLKNTVGSDAPSSNATPPRAVPSSAATHVDVLAETDGTGPTWCMMCRRIFAIMTAREGLKVVPTTPETTKRTRLRFVMMSDARQAKAKTVGPLNRFGVTCLANQAWMWSCSPAGERSKWLLRGVSPSPTAESQALAHSTTTMTRSRTVVSPLLKAGLCNFPPTMSNGK